MRNQSPSVETMPVHSVKEIVCKCFVLVVIVDKTERCMLDVFYAIYSSNVIAIPSFYSVLKLWVCYGQINYFSFNWILEIW